MEERKKHKVMIGIEVVLLCMLVAILGTNAASSNPPSNGVSYRKNNQTTVEGALNDLYNKANYGNASEGNILSGKTALVGGSKVTGTMVNWTGKPQAIDAVRLANGRFEVAVARGYHNYSWADNSYEYLTYKQVADTIGLTAGKLVKGESVLGITGTGTTGIDTSGATAEQGDILSGKTAYVNGSKVTGTMTNKGAVSGTVSPGGTYTIPAGYHNGSGKVTCSTCESNGYVKMYSFATSDLAITNEQNIGTSYKPLSYETTSSIKTTKISVTLDKEINNLVEGYIVIHGDIRVCTSRNSDGSCTASTYPLESRLHSISGGTPIFMNGVSSGIKISIDTNSNGEIAFYGRATCDSNVECSNVKVELNGKVLTLEFDRPCTGTCRNRYEGRNLNIWKVYGKLYYK